MTTSCDICGRGMAVQALTPSWFPHEHVCDRTRCRSVARDAVKATFESRKETDKLTGAIAARYETQAFAYGWRGDTMAKIDVVDNEDWWANTIAKRVE